MKSKIQRLGDKRILSLPPELMAELAWDAGDVLTAEIVKGGIKFTRMNTKHNEGMRIARAAMKKYRATLKRWQNPDRRLASRADGRP